MKIRYQLISAKTLDPSILLHSCYNQVLPARLCHLAMPSSPSRQWWSWIPDNSRHVHGGPVLKRKRIVLREFTDAIRTKSIKIHQNPSKSIKIWWHFYHVHSCSIVLAPDWLQTSPMTLPPTQGPLSSLPQAFDHGATLLFVGEQSCRLCQPLATRKPNLWILWQLNLLWR